MLVRLLPYLVVLSAACPDGSPDDEVTLSDQFEVADYAASAPETETRAILITNEVTDLTAIRASPLRSVATLTIANTVALATLAGLEGLERMDSLLVDQNTALADITLQVSDVAEFIEIQGPVGEVHLTQLKTAGRVLITGQACVIEMPLLEDVTSCEINGDRREGCEPPSASEFPACQ